VRVGTTCLPLLHLPSSLTTQLSIRKYIDFRLEKKKKKRKGRGGGGLGPAARDFPPVLSAISSCSPSVDRTRRACGEKEKKKEGMPWPHLRRVLLTGLCSRSGGEKKRKRKKKRKKEEQGKEHWPR